MSPQPDIPYYLQKLSRNIFGIVDHSTGKSRVYIFDERLGPKNSDHAISYLHNYLSDIPSWIQRLPIFLDHTGGTNKNMYTMAWAMEMVQHNKIRYCENKLYDSWPYKILSGSAFFLKLQSFNKSDVFNTAELCKVAEPYASVIVDQGDIVMEWHNCLTKYTKMPGIRSQHDFVFARRPSTRIAEVRVCELCHEGKSNEGCC